MIPKKFTNAYLKKKQNEEIICISDIDDVVYYEYLFVIDKITFYFKYSIFFNDVSDIWVEYEDNAIGFESVYLIQILNEILNLIKNNILDIFDGDKIEIFNEKYKIC